MQNATHRLTLVVALAALAVASLALGTQFAAAHGAGPNSVSLSAIPSVVSYQGRVLNGGSPANGSAFFKFAIVNASGSSSFWSNDGSSVAGSEPSAGVPLMLTNGLFTVLLGDPVFSGMTLPLGAAVFADGDRRLRVWFSSTGTGYTQLSPDERIAAVPFALNAQTLDGLDASAFAPSSHTHSAADITSGTLADARLSANVVLGGQAVSRLANDAGYLDSAGASAAGFISQSQADVRYARLQPNPQ